MKVVYPDFEQFATWVCEAATADELRRLTRAATRRLEIVAQALQEQPALPATGLEAALERFLDLAQDYQEELCPVIPLRL